MASLPARADAARAVLAYRAVSSLSFRQLMSASPDPVGDLVEHRYDRLAKAMLLRAGLDPTRLAPPELPELPPHRGRRALLYCCGPICGSLKTLRHADGVASDVESR